MLQLGMQAIGIETSVRLPSPRLAIVLLPRDEETQAMGRSIAIA